MKNLLFDDFFRIRFISTGVENPDQVSAVLELNPKHQIYKGHFPNQPVVPGVCLIQIIKEMLVCSFSKELSLIRTDEAKFLNIIDPLVNPILQMEAKIKYVEQNIDVSVVLSNEGQIFMKFRGTFKFS